MTSRTCNACTGLGRESKGQSLVEIRKILMPVQRPDCTKSWVTIKETQHLYVQGQARPTLVRILWSATSANLPSTKFAIRSAISHSGGGLRRTVLRTDGIHSLRSSLSRRRDSNAIGDNFPRCACPGLISEPHRLIQQSISFARAQRAAPYLWRAWVTHHSATRGRSKIVDE